jgi:hypothetical protein
LIYAIHGEGAWFAEVPEGKSVLANTIMKLLPEIRRNPEAFFSDIPKKSRISIEDPP